jgi:AcrR family transcriptional regulator
VADICRQAGVAKGLFYWYFPTKESMFSELMRTVQRDLRRAQAAAMDPTANPIEQLHQATAASVRFLADHHRFFALLDREGDEPAVAALRAEGRELYLADVERLVIRAQQAGWIPHGDASVKAVGIIGTVAVFAQASRAGTIAMSTDEVSMLVADWLVQALTGSSRYSTGRSNASG